MAMIQLTGGRKGIGVLGMAAFALLAPEVRAETCDVRVKVMDYKGAPARRTRVALKMESSGAVLEGVTENGMAELRDSAGRAVTDAEVGSSGERPDRVGRVFLFVPLGGTLSYPVKSRSSGSGAITLDCPAQQAPRESVTALR